MFFGGTFCDTRGEPDVSDKVAMEMTHVVADFG